MRSIKDMIEIAAEQGYDVIKQGADNYLFYESNIIKDFTKPLKVFRSAPDDVSVSKVYNGIPISLMSDYYYQMYSGFNPELYCYLLNKNDGEYINFNEILILKVANCNSIEKILNYFDDLVYSGFLKEKNDCIEFYSYPREKPLRPSRELIYPKKERLAPAKYN